MSGVPVPLTSVTCSEPWCTKFTVASMRCRRQRPPGFAGASYQKSPPPPYIGASTTSLRPSPLTSAIAVVMLPANGGRASIGTTCHGVCAGSAPS